MIEADILLRGQDPIEPIMAHPPEKDSDITLQEWLKEVKISGKGIKLDFKRLKEYTYSQCCFGFFTFVINSQLEEPSIVLTAHLHDTVYRLLHPP